MEITNNWEKYSEEYCKNIVTLEEYGKDKELKLLSCDNLAEYCSMAVIIYKNKVVMSSRSSINALFNEFLAICNLYEIMEEGN